jgi:three-Cys-motif partner protein
MKKNFDPIIPTENDGLIIPEVRIWSLEKYQLLGGYCDIFTKGMRRNWDSLVYLDLFAGAGFSKIKENGIILKSSPLISLSIPTKFDKYIFCEENNDLANALRKRISKETNGNSIEIFDHDCNIKINDIKNSIPSYSKQNTVLTFCFLDPFHLNLKFTTVQTLAAGFVDFLILQAFHMDANRNFKIYISENSEKIGNYFRECKLENRSAKIKIFAKRICKIFGRSI